MTEAMVYVLRTGWPWPDLPDFYAAWSLVYTRWLCVGFRRPRFD
jgi:transposase